MNKTTSLLSVLLIGASFALAGCGGDDKKDNPATTGSGGTA